MTSCYGSQALTTIKCVISTKASRSPSLVRETYTLVIIYHYSDAHYGPHIFHHHHPTHYYPSLLKLDTFGHD